MKNNYEIQDLRGFDSESLNFDDLENSLQSQLVEQMAELSDLELDFESVGNPASLGDTVSNVIWEQFINQIGNVAGEEFIRENKGLNLDLKKSAHIQTAENFEKGKIATHNHHIDHQARYDDYQSNFYTDANNDYFNKANQNLRNNGKTERYRYNEDSKRWEHNERGEWKPKLNGKYRGDFDDGRPTGNKSKNTAMDHTVPAAEFARDPEMNTFVDKKDQIKLANSKTNLNEIDAGANSSKRDSKVGEWIESTRDGKTPDERFDFDKEKMLKKDEKQRRDNEKAIKEGEQKSIETGKQSRKEEVFRIGGKALQGVIMALLAGLVKNIIQKLIVWLTSAKKNFKSFLASVKEAITKFFSELKQHLINATDSLLTTIAHAIFGPIISTIKKAWIFIKQGYKSIKEAIEYIKNPNNKGKSLSVLMLEVGKIVVAGLTVGGALLLGEIIEKTLMAFPVFAFPIPILGSLASILGIFFGAIVSGIIGAIALNLIDKMIANKKRSMIMSERISKGNEILNTQSLILATVSENVNKTKANSLQSMHERHSKLSEKFSRKQIELRKQENMRTKNDNDLDDCFNILNS